MTNLVDHVIDTLRRERNEARAQRDALLAALEILLKGHNPDECLMDAEECVLMQQALARAAIREATGETA